MLEIKDGQSFTISLGGELREHPGLAPCQIGQIERRADERDLSVRSEEAALLAFCRKSGCNFRNIVRAAGLPRDALPIDPQAACEADSNRESYAVEQLSKARRLWAICKAPRAKLTCAGAASLDRCRHHLAGRLTPSMCPAGCGCRQW